MITEFFAFVVLLVLAIDIALHLTGKPTISNLVHGLANQYIDYGIYVVITIIVFAKFGLEIGLYFACGCLVDHLFGERKKDLK